MKSKQLPLLTLFCFFFLPHSILTFAANFPTPNSPVDNTAVYDYHCLNNDLAIPDSKLRKLVLAFGRGNAIATVVIIVITLLNIIVYKLRQIQEANFGENLDVPSILPWEQLCRRFSLADILSATHNFDEALVIGRGGFGKVYKGVIDNGAITVAIKRLNPMSRQGAPEFWTEIEMLSQFRHSHLVSLIGYCNQSSEMILVYKYMDRGTLADHLHKIGRNDSSLALSWVQRLKICIGAARGLDYLHTGTGVQRRVIHRDVKSSNILLDENWAAKISDFGLSKIGPADQSCTHVSTNVKGTFGYLDPEYFLTRRLTRKSDVYAFGVVLFEVFSGRTAVDLRFDDEQRGLATWAQHCFKEGTLNEIIDPSIKEQILSNSLTPFAQIANQCLHKRPKKRPTMAEVVASLELALELQERTDSSMLDGGIFNTVGAYDGQDNVDSSMEEQEFINYGNDGLHDKQIDGITQLGDASSGQSRVKPNRIMAFRKMAWLPFFGTTRVTSGHVLNNMVADVKHRQTLGWGPLYLKFQYAKVNSDAKPSKNSKSNNNIGGNSTLQNKDGDVQQMGLQIVTPKLKIFTFAELKTATGNFSMNMLLGEGHFAMDIIGWVDEKTYIPSKVGVGMAIAVKKFDLKAFHGYIGRQSEVELLGNFSHPNLVTVLGYCLKNKELFLVYEYMQKGSLESQLFKRDTEPLPWVIRLKIAIGAARGLAFLHATEKQVMYHQFKTCNILLDGDFNAKLSHFEYTKLDPVSCYSYVDSYVPTLITEDLEDYSYTAPECLITGHVTEKSEVYRFGVVLLEILTGQRATDAMMPPDVNVISERWAWTYLQVDPWMKEHYPPEGAFQSALLVQKCLDPSPKNRPSMEEVLETLEHINAI